MFDDLRNDSEQSAFLQEVEKKGAAAAAQRGSSKPRKKKGGNFLGMNAFQRFVVATLLFVMVCMFSAVVLVLMGKVAIPL